PILALQRPSEPAFRKISMGRSDATRHLRRLVRWFPGGGGDCQWAGFGGTFDELIKWHPRKMGRAKGSEQDASCRATGRDARDAAFHSFSRDGNWAFDVCRIGMVYAPQQDACPGYR